MSLGGGTVGLNPLGARVTASGRVFIEGSEEITVTAASEIVSRHSGSSIELRADYVDIFGSLYAGETPAYEIQGGAPMATPGEVLSFAVGVSGQSFENLEVAVPEAGGSEEAQGQSLAEAVSEGLANGGLSEITVAFVNGGLLLASGLEFTMTAETGVLDSLGLQERTWPVS